MSSEQEPAGNSAPRSERAARFLRHVYADTLYGRPHVMGPGVREYPGQPASDEVTSSGNIPGQSRRFITYTCDAEGNYDVVFDPVVRNSEDKTDE